MKTVDEIIEYMDEADKWSAAKEEGLICRMGGGKMINGRFHVNPNMYRMCTERIKKAKRKLGKRDNDENWEDFQEEIANMFA